MSRALHLSHSSELPLRLRWLAILSGKVKASLAVSGDVHTVVDVIQSVMTGAPGLARGGLTIAAAPAIIGVPWAEIGLSVQGAPGRERS